MENTQSESSTLPGKRSTNDDGGGDNSDGGGDGDGDDDDSDGDDNDDDDGDGESDGGDGDDDGGDARSKYFRNAYTPISSHVLRISRTLVHQSDRPF